MAHEKPKTTGELLLTVKELAGSPDTPVALHDPDTGWLLPLRVHRLTDEDGKEWLVLTGRYTDETMGCETIA